MNISSGRFKGLSLGFPQDRGFRPTQAKVRAAVFNILGPEIEDAVFLDLCCGTGSMGLEALSRGAASVVMVDTNTRFAQENVAKVQKQASEALPVRVVRTKMESFLSHPGPEKFSVVFFDPPWDLGGYEHVLKVLNDADILAANATVLFEHRRSVKLAAYGRLQIQKIYTYGDTYLTLFRRSAP